MCDLLPAEEQIPIIRATALFQRLSGPILEKKNGVALREVWWRAVDGSY
jgi:hypothetical protein